MTRREIANSFKCRKCGQYWSEESGAYPGFVCENCASDKEIKVGGYKTGQSNRRLWQMRAWDRKEDSGLNVYSVPPELSKNYETKAEADEAAYSQRSFYKHTSVRELK